MNRLISRLIGGWRTGLSGPASNFANPNPRPPAPASNFASPIPRPPAPAHNSPPLTPGNHVVVGSVRFNGPVSGAPGCTASSTTTTAAGTAQTFSKTIVVS